MIVRPPGEPVTSTGLPSLARIVGVTEVAGTVEETAAHDFGGDMPTCGAIRAEALHVETFQHIEHFDQTNAAGSGRRRAEDVVAAVGAANGSSLNGLIAAKVGHSDQ